MIRVGNVLRGQTPWIARIDGDDILLENVYATCWGGGHDPGDNGETESRRMNDGRDPNLMGIALPIRSIEAATAGSPLAFPGPHIPWFTKARAWLNRQSESEAITLELIDNGPDEIHYPTHAVDLTVAAAHHFSPTIPLERLPRVFGLKGLNIRILGAAKYAPAA